MTETCTWIQQCDESDCWEALCCGNLFVTLDGSPTESGMTYCCFCGKPLVSEPFKEEVE